MARFGDNTFAHGGYITELALAPEASRIITVGGRHDVRIWNEDGDLLQSLPRERSLMNASLSMDSRWRLGTEWVDTAPRQGQYFHVGVNLVTGGSFRLGPVPYPAYSMSISADGALLAVGDVGARLSLVEVNGGRTLASTVLPGQDNVGGYPRVFLTPDGSLLFAEQPEGSWFLYDMKDRNLEHPLPTFDKSNGAKPVMSSQKGLGAVVGRNGRIVVRDFFQGKNLAEFKHGNVTALDAAFSPDDQLLATCGADGDIRLWTVAEGKLIREIQAEERHPYAVAFTADGATLVSGGGQGRVRFWDVATGREELLGKTTAFGAVKSVALSPDGRTAALAGALGDVSLWSVKAGERLGLLPDDELDRGVRYDPWVGHNFLAFTPNGRVLVAGSSNRHNSVNLWDLASRQREARCVGHDWPITCVAASPDGEMIVSGSRDKTIRAWDTSGKELWQATGNGAQVLTLAFAPTGEKVYSAGHTITIDVWRAKDGSLAEQITITSDPAAPQALNAISAVAVSQSERYLAAVIGESTSGRRVEVITLADRQPAFTIGGDGDAFVPLPDDTYYAVAFDRQHDVLAVGRGDGAILLYHAPSEKLLETFRGHIGAVHSLAWSADGTRLLSGSTDGTAVIWDTAFLHPQ